MFIVLILTFYLVAVTDMAHGEVSCRIHTPLAENQKSESHCVYIVFTDMAGTTIRMIRGTPNEPFLSPMPLVDRHLTENEYVYLTLLPTVISVLKQEMTIHTSVNHAITMHGMTSAIGKEATFGIILLEFVTHLKI